MSGIAGHARNDRIRVGRVKVVSCFVEFDIKVVLAFDWFVLTVLFFFKGRGFARNDGIRGWYKMLKNRF